MKTNGGLMKKLMTGLFGIGGIVIRGAGCYLLRVLTVLDIMVQVLVFDGDPHETISDRAALARGKGKRWGCALCRWLDKINPGHCDRALSLVQHPLTDRSDM